MGDKNNIVSIWPDVPAYSPGESIPKIVSIIEGLLAQAREGNIRAFASIAVVAPDTSTPSIETRFHCEMGRSRDLWVGVGRLERRVANWLDS